MEIPNEIVGDNKDRDFSICLAYIDGLDAKDIKENGNFGLTLRRVHQILYEQRTFLNGKVGWDKTKRLHVLQKVAEKAGFRLGPTKDILNVIEQIRKETEGEANILIDQSTTNHITYAWNNNNDKIQPADVSERNTRGQAQIQSP